MQGSLDASLVRIRTPNGHVVGAGFLVGERQVLTCAHVVASALGLADDTPEQPQARVSLDMPRVASRKLLTAHVVLWRPPRAEKEGDDVAGLELDDDPPHGAEIAPLAQVEDLWEHAFRAFGFPRGQDSGVWTTGRLMGRQSNNWVQIEDVKEPGFAVEPGFSGAPVWDTQVEAVVGMVVAAERRTDLKTAFAIPVDVLAASWPLLEARIHPFVFLCYARADSELVTRLRTDLLSRGIQVWTDREGLQPGTLDWEEALRTAIRAAQAVLLIASPQARSSRYVRDELRIAELYQRPVYPLWIAGTHWMDAVPLGWGGAQYLDARESGYQTAIPALVDLLNTASTPPAKPAEPDFEPRNPYKGLDAFTGDDAHDFFGRDALINDLVVTLAGALGPEEEGQQCERLLAVVGPSGSGKSSVVMAGLLPRLREGRLPGSEQWVYLDPIVPGSRPIEHLALALSDHLPYTPTAIQKDLEDDAARGLHLLAMKLAKQPGIRIVLLVDQFEELFTQTPSEDERRHFLDLLVTAATEPHGPVIILLTLRADFYDRPMRYPELGQLIDHHHQLVFPMKIDELRATIERPAALSDVGLTFEGDLVGDLLFEVQGQVGALPLLQFTLQQLFQQRSGRQLTLSAYRELGGVKGALTRQAEKTYSELPSEEHRRLSRALFVRLIDPGASEQDTTRRRAALSEFTLDDPPRTHLMQESIDAFIAARLLTTNEVAGTTTIEVSHEALIPEWPRLAEWMREARQDIPLQQAISEDAAEWERRGKPGDRLYRGSQLKEAQAWARRNTPSGNEVAFLRAGTASRVRSLVSVVAIFLLLASTSGLVTWFLLHTPNIPNPTSVTNLHDRGPGSLRQAIDTSPAGSTITFDASLSGTIMLTSNDLNIVKNLTISGPVTHAIAVSSGSSGHIIHVLAGVSFAISNLIFKGSQNVGNCFIFNQGGKLTLTNSIVSGNHGCGIYNYGTLTLTNSTVSGNTGGIPNQAGTLTLTNRTVSGNTSGIYNQRAMLTLNNSTVPDNPASGGTIDGGINNYGTLTLTNSTVSDNTGGILNGPNSRVTLTNSTVSDNSASSPYGGGGIFNSGTLILTNSTVSGNSASSGGGIFNSGTLTITFSTITDNTATVGADITNTDLGSPQHIQVTISNSIVADDRSSAGPDISGFLISGGYNLFQDNSGATFDPSSVLHRTDTFLSANDLSRLFASSVGPRNNGGPTKTYALAPGSRAIDAIPLQDCQLKVIFDSQSRKYTDQRGFPRPDGNEGACDIGAYEFVD